jgi:hypothetical protein
MYAGMEIKDSRVAGMYAGMEKNPKKQIAGLKLSSAVGYLWKIVAVKFGITILQHPLHCLPCL